ncbi:MAG: CARDB domain-containing protein [Pseudomonadota bacterium]
MLPDFKILSQSAQINYQNSPYTFNFEFSYGVFNDGAGDAENVYIAFLKPSASDPTVLAAESLFNFTSHDLVAGGGHYGQYYETLNVNFGATGSYYVTLQVDYGNQWDEYNETNNTLTNFKVDVLSSSSANLSKWAYTWHFGWHLDWAYGWADGWHYGWYNGWNFGWFDGWYFDGTGWQMGWYQGWGVGWALGWSTGWYVGWYYGWTQGVFYGWGWDTVDTALSLTPA